MGEFNQQRPAAESEFHALKQENAALNNELNQPKQNFEKLRTSCESHKLRLVQEPRHLVMRPEERENLVSAPRRPRSPLHL